MIKLSGKVLEVLISSGEDSYVTKPLEKVRFLDAHGPIGDMHSGRRLLDVRDREAINFGLIKGSEVFNMRQWSAISAEDSLEISNDLGIPNIPPGYFGENILIEGIPNFSKLKVGTQIFFSSPKNEIRSTLLFVTAENNPCITIANEIQKLNPEAQWLAKHFPSCAINKRGLVGIVVSSGFIKKGDIVTAYVLP